MIETGDELRIAINPDGTIRSLDGFWLPAICLKQFEVFNCFKRYVLLAGPRRSAKTVAVVNKIIRHAWENDRALIAIITKTIKNAKAGGVWEDLIKFALPQWIEANIGLKYTQEPKVTGDARMNLLRISNRHGTESEIQLHSIDYCGEMSSKFKGTRFSMFFISELDNFDSRVVFDVAVDQLRSFTVPREQQQFMADTNPPSSGTRNWQHDFWFKEKDRLDHPDPDYQQEICRIDFKISDNPFLTPQEVAELKAKYRSQKSVYDRYVDGIWTEGSEGSHFIDVFNEEVHIMGSTTTGERILPSPGCLEQSQGSGALITGWDLGEVNHSWSLLEKIEVDGEDGKTITKFALIEDLVVVKKEIGKVIGIRAFVEEVLDRMDKWENWCLKTYKRKPRWRHFSDNSAFKIKSLAESSDELLVREISNGKVNLAAAPKYRNSVRDRVKLTHQLLFEQRLFFAAQCEKTITAIKSIKKGESSVEYVQINEFKHPFDSLSYALISEAPIDLVLLNDLKVGKFKNRSVVCV